MSKESSGMFFGSHFLYTFETWSCHLIFAHISHSTEFDDLHL